jgi:AraC-like DNA-binding protein
VPSSTFRTFTDPDDYAASVRAGNVDLTVTGRGDFNAKLIRIDLRRMWLQRFSENLPRLVNVTNMVRGRIYVMFRTLPGASLVQAGVEFLPSGILRLYPSMDYYQRSSGPIDFGTMSLPVEDSGSVLEALAGIDLTPANQVRLITPSPAAMVRLQRLHAAAGHLAEHAPEIIANPLASRGLEQALTGAMAECLGQGNEQRHSLAQGQHAVVMRRFRKVLEENPEEPLFIPEICKAIGVAERTLRLCCQEHLGMSPKRYLVLRRLNLVRRALRNAVPGTTSVTAVATGHGFWELGRFAIEYQRLFAESPATTLRRSPD